VEVGGREVALGDAALRCNDGTREAGGDQACDGVRRPGNRDEIVQAFRLDRQHEGAIEVKKDGPAIHRVAT